MTTLLPPTERLWWREPVDRVEILWIVIALIWAMILSMMMPYWHLFGKQNISNTAYHVDPQAYDARAKAVDGKYVVRSEGGTPVVHPPPGADVYMVARQWQWWPIVEFEKGKSYRLHLSSVDVLHGFSLQPENINLEVVPGYEMVLTIEPNHAGTYSVVCNEYCGIGHQFMLGRVDVTK